MTLKPPHILIVDDNPENIQVLGAALASYSYQITIATTGEIAIKAAQEHVPDLILLDVMMPGLDGFEVCHFLKSEPTTKDIEILFVTAAVTPGDELKGLSLGAVDYIHKPFSIPIVQTKVALHLARAQCKKELELKNAALEENARLREDIERITRHDLKTPLNALLAYPQMMLAEPDLTEQRRRYLKNMIKAGNQMLHMINNSLDIFKMETGCYQLSPVNIDLVAIINRIIRDLQKLTEAKQLDINIQIAGQNADEQFFPVLAEECLAYSLFANLIRNAIEASLIGDTIIIEMFYEANNGVIAITNPGAVPVAIRATFFEKYATAGKAKGTGLGTYSARLMTVTQNGSITMTTDSKETCITVRLPQASL